MPSSSLVPEPLLCTDDPAVFQVERGAAGDSHFVLTCDHAGRVLPKALGTLGLAAADLTRHIAWDLGIAGVGRELSKRLDAFLILQTYSRLVIDCNRPPGTPQSIVTRSERTEIPGNVGLSRASAEQRAREIFHPYHDRIVRELDARAAQGKPAVLVTLHSFTPTFMERSRAWHCGVLYHREQRLGRALLELLRAQPELVVGDNEPYAASAETDYTLTVHGEQRGLMVVELEIRQDLIAHAAGQLAWGERLAQLLPRAYALASASAQFSVATHPSAPPAPG